MNWAAADLGAVVISCSSELPGCEAKNILDNDLSKIWLSEDGIPQWISMSLHSISQVEDVEVRTIGWHCWHPFVTNPREARIHVSRDGSKYRIWDSFEVESMKEGTQLFCCQPISISIYPFITLEILSTFGGPNTYINQVYLYSEEISFARNTEDDDNSVHSELSEDSLSLSHSTFLQRSSKHSGGKNNIAILQNGGASISQSLIEDTALIEDKLNHYLGLNDNVHNLNYNHNNREVRNFLSTVPESPPDMKPSTTGIAIEQLLSPDSLPSVYQPIKNNVLLSTTVTSMRSNEKEDEEDEDDDLFLLSSSLPMTSTHTSPNRHMTIPSSVPPTTATVRSAEKAVNTEEEDANVLEEKATEAYLGYRQQHYSSPGVLSVASNNVDVDRRLQQLEERFMSLSELLHKTLTPSSAASTTQPPSSLQSNADTPTTAEKSVHRPHALSFQDSPGTVATTPAASEVEDKSVQAASIASSQQEEYEDEDAVSQASSKQSGRGGHTKPSRGIPIINVKSNPTTNTSKSKVRVEALLQQILTEVRQSHHQLTSEANQQNREEEESESESVQSESRSHHSYRVHDIPRHRHHHQSEPRHQERYFAPPPPPPPLPPLPSFAKSHHHSHSHLSSSNSNTSTAYNYESNPNPFRKHSPSTTALRNSNPYHTLFEHKMDDEAKESGDLHRYHNRTYPLSSVPDRNNLPSFSSYEPYDMTQKRDDAFQKHAHSTEHTSFGNLRTITHNHQSNAFPVSSSSGATDRFPHTKTYHDHYPFDKISDEELEKHYVFSGKNDDNNDIYINTATLASSYPPVAAIHTQDHSHSLHNNLHYLHDSEQRQQQHHNQQRQKENPYFAMYNSHDRDNAYWTEAFQKHKKEQLSQQQLQQQQQQYRENLPMTQVPSLPSDPPHNRNNNSDSSVFDHIQAIQLIRQQAMHSAANTNTTTNNTTATNTNNITNTNKAYTTSASTTSTIPVGALGEEMDDLIQQLHSRVLQKTMKEAQLKILTTATTKSSSKLK